MTAETRAPGQEHERHTPGPWFVTPGPEQDEWGVGHTISGTPNPFGIAQMVWKQDAPLIAAAPELLAVIREYLEWGAMTGSDRDYFEQKFRAAVAHADGQP